MVSTSATSSEENGPNYYSIVDSVWCGRAKHSAAAAWRRRKPRSLRRTADLVESFPSPSHETGTVRRQTCSHILAPAFPLLQLLCFVAVAACVSNSLDLAAPRAQYLLQET